MSSIVGAHTISSKTQPNNNAAPARQTVIPGLKTAKYFNYRALFARYEIFWLVQVRTTQQLGWDGNDLPVIWTITTCSALLFIHWNGKHLLKVCIRIEGKQMYWTITAIVSSAIITNNYHHCQRHNLCQHHKIPDIILQALSSRFTLCLNAVWRRAKTSPTLNDNPSSLYISSSTSEKYSFTKLRNTVYSLAKSENLHDLEWQNFFLISSSQSGKCGFTKLRNTI